MVYICCFCLNHCCQLWQSLYLFHYKNTFTGLCNWVNGSPRWKSGTSALLKTRETLVKTYPKGRLLLVLRYSAHKINAAVLVVKKSKGIKNHIEYPQLEVQWVFIRSITFFWSKHIQNIFSNNKRINEYKNEN